MKVITNNFLAWLMSLTTIMRYFVIALLLHVAILVVLGSIKIVVAVPDIIASFTGAPLPPPSDDLPDDPYAAYRDFEYKGPELGDGGGLGGKGPGGSPLAGGQQYSASIQSAAVAAEAPSVGEVIGVFSDAATAIARPVSTGPTGVGNAPVSGLGDALAGAGIKGPGGPWLGAGRMGPKRAINLKQYGGSQETERAVLAALRWLKANQRPDGSWPLRNDAGTALGALCFLGHGENADSPEFGATVQKALEKLAKAVPANGNVTGAMYEQGLVTLALSEGYMLTSSPMLREPLERATKLILTAQKVPKTNPIHTGGWHYSPQAATADTSVTGWVFMAMKSAKAAGIEVPQEHMDLAAQYFWNAYHPGGGFGYNGPALGGAMTPVGVFCQQMLGNGKDKRLDKALDNMRKETMNWETDGGWAMYRWYYHTLAMFQGGGQYWGPWNKIMRDTLLKTQKEDGHWPVPPKSAEAGHLGNDPLGPKVYSTTLATLMLEVYYRYLPIYQLIEQPTVPKPAPTTAVKS